MRAIIAGTWKDRLPSALGALALQAALFAVLAFSFTAIVRAPQREQEIIYLLPPLPPLPPSDPMVIDARPRRTPAPPSAATSGLPAMPGGGGITAAPPTAQIPAPEAPAILQSLGRQTDCSTQPQKPSSLCPPVIAKPSPNAFDPNPPSGVLDEERWAEEKRRQGNSPSFEVAPGVTVGPVGPGIGVVIQDPLCKLVTFLLQAGSCGPRPKNANPATEEQFQAALAAYHKRRGGGPKPALASKPKTGDANEKNNDRGGNHSGAGAIGGAGAK